MQNGLNSVRTIKTRQNTLNSYEYFEKEMHSSISLYIHVHGFSMKESAEV